MADLESSQNGCYSISTSPLGGDGRSMRSRRKGGRNLCIAAGIYNIEADTTVPLQLGSGPTAYRESSPVSSIRRGAESIRGFRRERRISTEPRGPLRRATYQWGRGSSLRLAVAQFAPL